jgi:hypothetical protein
MSVAHLIKLEDYISRYQFDLTRYPSQYTRMKKERWYYHKSEWEQKQALSSSENERNVTHMIEGRTRGLLTETVKRIRRWSKRSQIEKELVSSELEPEKFNESFEQMKEEFSNNLFDAQLNWASSSLLEESSFDPKYRSDTWLKFFAQQIPDNYFLMYKPIFFIKQAYIELDVLLISPTEVFCISILEGHEHSVFEASSERFWTEFIHKTRKKRISPLMSLSRMTGVVTPILMGANVNFPVRTVVLCPSSIIDNKIQGAKVELVDRRNFSKWHERIKNHPSPIKNQQMKVTSLLFDYCFTAASKRSQEPKEEDSF